MAVTSPFLLVLATLPLSLHKRLHLLSILQTRLKIRLSSFDHLDLLKLNNPYTHTHLLLDREEFVGSI